MGANYSFYVASNVASIVTFALTFFGYIISVLASVLSNQLKKTIKVRFTLKMYVEYELEVFALFFYCSLHGIAFKKRNGSFGTCRIGGTTWND